ARAACTTLLLFEGAHAARAGNRNSRRRVLRSASRSRSIRASFISAFASSSALFFETTFAPRPPTLPGVRAEPATNRNRIPQARGGFDAWPRLACRRGSWPCAPAQVPGLDARAPSGWSAKAGSGVADSRPGWVHYGAAREE